MLKVLFLVFGLLASSVVTAKSEQCETLRVGGASGWLPITYVNPASEDHEGIALDLLRHIAKQLQIPLQIDLAIPWKRTLSYLESGELDLVLAMYKTNPRAALYHFTLPYFDNQARVFVLEDQAFEFNHFEDLMGRVGGVPFGGSFGEDFDTFSKKSGVALQYLESKEQLVELLLLGRIDYFIQDHLDAVLYMESQGLKQEIIALEHPLASESVHFALSRHSACAALLPKINQLIIAAKHDGSLDAIMAPYLR